MILSSIRFYKYYMLLLINLLIIQQRTMFRNPLYLCFFIIFIWIVQCTLLPIPDFCERVTFNNLCLNCLPGYQLDEENNQCRKQNQIKSWESIPQTSGVEVEAVNINCKVRWPASPDLPDFRCKQCYDGFYVNKQTGECQPRNPLCKESNNQGQCLSCFRGYKLVSGQCQEAQAKNSDPNCFQQFQGNCIKCAYRFFFNSQGKCSIVSPLCKTWNEKTGACQSCFDGYKLKRSKCVAQQNTQVNIAQVTSQNIETQNCAQFNKKGECIKCSFRHFFRQFKCIPVDDLCRTWDLNLGTCKDCYYGYQEFNGKCLRQIPNCNIRSSQGCVQCSNGYYLNNQLSCSAVDPLCQFFDPFTGKCTKCLKNYRLVGGKCVG